MSDIHKLYAPAIRQHNDHPYHFERWDDAPFRIKAVNSICGDRYEVFAMIADGRLMKLCFHGIGCAVSMAAASVLVKSLEGLELNRARDWCNAFGGFINGSSPADLPNEDWYAFEAVRQFPERLDCAGLVWRIMGDFLTKKIEEEQI